MKERRIGYGALLVAALFIFLFVFPPISVDSAAADDIADGPIAIEGAEASVAGFLGEAERGPAEPHLLNNWEEYKTLYGEGKGGSSYLPYAVKGFFENGGNKLYVARIVDKAATSAKVTLFSGKTPAFTLRAIGEGSWGNRLRVLVSAASDKGKDSSGFKLEIYYDDAKPSNSKLNLPLGKLNNNPFPSKSSLPLGQLNKNPFPRETFDNLSMDRGSANYYAYIIEQRSNLIAVENKMGELGSKEAPGLLGAPLDFSGGTDGGILDLEDYLEGGEGIGRARGLSALDAINEISLLYCPDAQRVNGLANELIRHCEDLSDRMVILDSKKGDSNPVLDEIHRSSYAALYYPWIEIDGSLPGEQLLIPPGGHIAGIYSLVESQYGINKAPAGIAIKGATGLEFNISNEFASALDPRGINTIKDFDSRGIMVWGSKTLAYQEESEYRYVSIRRLKNYIEKSICEGLSWTGGRCNDQQLWAEVNVCITDFLTKEWRKGSLMGNEARLAFFVKADRTIMTQTDIEEGRLIIEAGAAFLKPAEFYIIRIKLPVQGDN